MPEPSERIKVMVGVIVASIGLHALLLPVGDELLSLAGSGRTLPAPAGVMEVALLPEELEPEAEDNPAEPPGKLVQLDRVDDQRPPEHDTPYVSEFDNRASKATRAPNLRPEPGSTPSQPGDRPDARPDPSTRTAESPSDARPLDLLPQGDRDGASDDEIPEDDRGERARAGASRPSLSPAGSPGTRDALRKALGGSGSFDDVGEDIDVGSDNAFDTKRWKFASFFNRVRDSVAQHWHPETVHAARDPDASIHGTRVFKTKLLISLNPDGSLHKVRMQPGGDSGVDYLDEEAIQAVRQAAPFTNPPPGLVDAATGKIEFGFGFIFDVQGGRRIFRYQR